MIKHAVFAAAMMAVGAVEGAIKPADYDPRTEDLYAYAHTYCGQDYPKGQTTEEFIAKHDIFRGVAKKLLAWAGEANVLELADRLSAANRNEYFKAMSDDEICGNIAITIVPAFAAELGLNPY